MPAAKPTLFKARYVRRPLPLPPAAASRRRALLSRRNSPKFRRSRRLMTVAHRPRRIRKVMRPLLQWYYNLNLLSLRRSLLPLGVPPPPLPRAAATAAPFLPSCSPSVASARPARERVRARPNRLSSLSFSPSSPSSPFPFFFFFYQPTSTRCVRPT